MKDSFGTFSARTLATVYVGAAWRCLTAIQGSSRDKPLAQRPVGRGALVDASSTAVNHHVTRLLPKSVTLAALLAFLTGPLGLLYYCTVAGAW